MREYVMWLILLAVTFYPIYFAVVYGLAKAGILPREWVSRSTTAMLSVVVTPVGANTMVTAESISLVSSGGTYAKAA